MKDLPHLNRPGAYDRLRLLQRRRRSAARAAVALFCANLVALAIYAMMLDVGRYLHGG